MKNTSVSLFRQVQDLIPKREFEEIVMKQDGDKRKQSFDCRARFVSMIFSQLLQANSLRESSEENGLWWKLNDTGDVSYMESPYLPGLAAMAGSAFHKASGAGEFSPGIFISGQRFQQQGGLLLKNHVSSKPLSGDKHQMTPF